MKKLTSFILAVLLIFSLAGCVENKSFPQIELEQVEKITVWVQSAEQQLNSGDVDKFIQLYNDSEYSGEGTGEGGSPVYGVTVYFSDGSVLRVNNFQASGHDFEVTLHNTNGKKEVWCYINNQALVEYLSEMVTPT